MAEQGDIKPGSPEVKETFADAAQRHHDYYVNLEQAGKLSEEDRPNLVLAKQGESAGEVKPLTPTEPAKNPITGKVPGILEAGIFMPQTGKVEAQGSIKPAGGK